MEYLVIDYWRDGDTYYAIVLENNILYFSEAKIPANLKETDEPR